MKQYGQLNDTFYFWFAGNDTSGSGGDGASPAADVRLAGAAADAAPVYSPTPILLSHASYPAGAYEIAIAATAANGFSSTNTYAVFCTLAIDSQNPTGFVGSFDLKPIEANTIHLGWVSQSLMDLKDFADAGYDPSTNKVQGVVLCDTTTTNTDMVGTNNAALAATALSNTVWTNTKAGFIDASIQTVDTVADGIQTDLSNATDGLGALKSLIDTVDGVVDDILVDTGTTLPARFDGVEGATFVTGTDSLEALRNRGDAEWITATGFNTVVPDAAGVAATPAEVATALSNIHLDHLLAVDYDPASKPGVATALLNELIESDGGVSRYTANALEQAPSAGTNPNVLIDTTIASVTDQTHFTLTDGSNDNDAYKDQAIVLYDASDSDYPSIRVCDGYVGSTKTITLDSAPDFTIVGGDGCKAFVTAPGTTAPTVGQIRTEMEGAGYKLATIEADTNELQTNQGNWLTATGFATSGALSTHDGKLDTVDTNVDAILVDTGTTLPATLTDIEGATFVTGTDSLEAIRNRGDSAWTTGAGGSDRLLMVDTTIATLASQTSFTLNAGSADNDAYNNCTIVIEDASTATQKAVAIISDYVGSTKTVTLKYDPAIFTMAVTDKVYILAENALKATLANRQLNVAADGDIAGNIDGNVASVVGSVAQTGDSYARLGAPAGVSIAADLVTIDNFVDDLETRLSSTRAGYLDNLSAGAVALASICTDTRLAELDAANLPTDIANVPTVTEFNARTLASADYIVTTDTIAGVTTVTNLTNAPTAGDLTAAMKASVNAEADTALTDYAPPTRTEATADKDAIITQVNANETKIDTIDGIVDAILLDTGTDGVVVAVASKTGYALSAVGIAAIIDEVIEGTLTFRQIQRILLSVCAEKSTGGGTNTLGFRNHADTKNRLTETVDANGNRTAVTLDGT